MDWFLYDNGLRHERIKTNYFQKKMIYVWQGSKDACEK